MINKKGQERTEEFGETIIKIIGYAILFAIALWLVIKVINSVTG